MKKALYLVLLSCLLPLCGFTQNWQCLQTGVTRYYAGEYLRGMRIDSVKTVGDTIIQYPFHSPRGPYLTDFPVLDTNGGSWLGKEVSILPDGTTLFDNLWGDTCIIRTRATLGDSWMFYDDTTTRYYTATVVSLDTMTLLGITDSVKDILLQAYANNVLNPADPLHNRHIILSKEHGFQYTLSIYSFPYHSQSNTVGNYSLEDYLMDRIEYNHSLQQPYIYQLIDSPTFKKTDLYDFQPGEVFATKQEYSFGSNYINWSMDSIISRTDINEDTIIYTILTTTRHQNIIYPYSSTTTVNVRATTVYNTPFSILTNLYGLPDESPVTSFITYRPNDSSHCYKSLLYGIGPSYISGNILNNFEPCGEENLYKNGFGHVYNSTCYDPSGSNNSVMNMIYSKKNGTACGYPPVLGVEEVSATDAISIYPIPADRELHLSVPQKEYTYTITDLSGKILLDGNAANECTLNTRGLASGLYLLTIQDTRSPQRISRKVTVQH